MDFLLAALDLILLPQLLEQWEQLLINGQQIGIIRKLLDQALVEFSGTAIRP